MTNSFIALSASYGTTPRTYSEVEGAVEYTGGYHSWSNIERLKDPPSRLVLEDYKDPGVACRRSPSSAAVCELVDTHADGSMDLNALTRRRQR